MIKKCKSPHTPNVKCLNHIGGVGGLNSVIGLSYVRTLCSFSPGMVLKAWVHLLRGCRSC